MTDQSNHPPAWKPLALTVIAGTLTAGRSNDFKLGSRRCLELTVNDSIGRFDTFCCDTFCLLLVVGSEKI